MRKYRELLEGIRFYFQIQRGLKRKATFASCMFQYFEVYVYFFMLTPLQFVVLSWYKKHLQWEGGSKNHRTALTFVCISSFFLVCAMSILFDYGTFKQKLIATFNCFFFQLFRYFWRKETSQYVNFNFCPEIRSTSKNY